MRWVVLVILVAVAACDASPGGVDDEPRFSRSEQEPLPSTRPVDRWRALAGDDGGACRAELVRAGYQFSPMPDRTEPDARGCGIPHPVRVRRGPTGIRYARPLRIDCTLARALGSVEKIVQEEAQAQLGQPIVRIETMGSYECRPIRGSTRLSEHAFGDALDLARFVPRRGRTISVERDWPGEGPRTTFLRRVEERWRRETALSHVLGPAYNRDHHDHFHIDRRLRFWWWPFRRNS